MEIRKNALAPQLFLELYSSVGWKAPTIEQVEVAFRNTVVNFTAYDEDMPVGMVRLLGDGGMSFYIKDFVVIPTYQSKGIGMTLLESVEKYIKEFIKDGWAVSLELISTKEAVHFYKKAGFEERPCKCDGPGMFKMIR